MRAAARRPATHAEDEYHMQDSFHIAEEATNVCAHTVWRDAESARLATERLLRIAKRTRRRVHVLHITTAGKVTFLATHKDVATVECTPQHLILSSPDLYDRLRPFAQINSPIRDAHHRAKLWTGVQSGVVDVFGFGHAPHTREENPGTYPNTPSGMPGVQILVPVMLNHVHEGRLSLERFVDLTAHGPQRIYNIAGKGRLAVGYDADFTLIDLQGTRTITDDWIVRKCGWTPFIDMKTTGYDHSRCRSHARRRSAGQPHRNAGSVSGHDGQELSFGSDRNFITVQIGEVQSAAAKEIENWFHNITTRRFNAFQNIR